MSHDIPSASKLLSSDSSLLVNASIFSSIYTGRNSVACIAATRQMCVVCLDKHSAILTLVSNLYLQEKAKYEHGVNL